MNALDFINEIKNRECNKNKFAYQVPISEFTDRFPILNDVWSHYKGMCNYGTESSKQTNMLNNIIKKVDYLSSMRNEVMSYPDKKKYDSFEHEERFGNENNRPVIIPYNDVWRLKNGKYQHLVNNLPFPRYHWNQEKLNLLNQIGCEPRGNFYYPAGGFREWHSNRKDGTGYRIYFIACEQDNKSGLNYIDPNDNKVKILYDKNEHANIFYVNDSVDNPFFHSVFSDTDRFSFGFNVYN